MITRRQFTIGSVSLAFAGLASSALGKANTPLNISHKGYGPLVPDPKGILDLPKEFSYEVISTLAETMSDGLHVPDRADGMGCIPLDNDSVALVRNHELHHRHLPGQPISIQSHRSDKAYDKFENGVAFPGGTSTIVYNTKTKQKESEFMSLTGTVRNCAGGTTPWGSWLTCEESVEGVANGLNKDHGYIFEVPGNNKSLVNPVPLKAMGRFNHEAAAVDPNTGIVYLTEDRNDSLLYRFIPRVPGELVKGGKLQALVVKGKPQFDTRNWQTNSMAPMQWYETEWVDLDNPESPNDDLRLQGHEKGAALFARGEGIHWGDSEAYFCCTSGGSKKLGQVMRYQPSDYEGSLQESEAPGRLQIFVESHDPSLFNFGDNLTVTPQGHLLVCEDQYTDTVNNHLRGVTPSGELYTFASLSLQTELAGACFSPDGTTLFVNVYSPTKTLAIRGPWSAIS